MINWYFKYKKAQSGEWWIIDGTAMFADSTICDYNHSGIVIEHILASHDFGEDVDLESLTKEQIALLSKEEKDVVLNKVDARDYGMKHLGWKRVANNNVQTENLTENDLVDIINGLFNAYEREIEEKEDLSFNIEVNSTNVIYEDVPWKILEKESLVELMPYRRKF